MSRAGEQAANALMAKVDFNMVRRFIEKECEGPSEDESLSFDFMPVRQFNPASRCGARAVLASPNRAATVRERRGLSKCQALPCGRGSVGML